MNGFGFGGFGPGGPGYGGMFRQPNLFGRPPVQTSANIFGDIGRGLGKWWEGLGEGKDDVILGALGGLGDYLEGRAERQSRERMHGREMSLQEQEFADMQAERERRRRQWEEWLIRNGLR